MNLTKLSLCSAIGLSFVLALYSGADPHILVPEIKELIFYKIPSQHSTVSIDDLLKICPDVNRLGATDACLDILSQHFMSDPIWAASRIDYHTPLRTRPGYAFLSKRQRILVFRQRAK